jgi:hypothetical protein
MKYIYHYLIIVGMLIGMMSCSYTDLKPTDKVGDHEIFSSVFTLEQATTGIYAKMSLRTTLNVSAILSDDVYKGGQNGGAGDDSYQWTYSAATGDHNNLWSSYYGIINMANRVLEGAKTVQANNQVEEKIKQDCIGTALFIRAYTSFDLLRFFADFDKKENLGIPYSKQKVVLETLGRNTVAECYQEMVKDLETAIPLLSQVVPETPCYASQLAAKALLARINLYARNYNLAYQYAAEVLKQKPIVGIQKYPKIWSDETKDEIIFELTRLPGEETIGTLFWSADNSSSFEPSTELIKSYDEKDVRLKTFIGDGVDRDNVPVKRVNKYKGTKENVGLSNQKMIRSSEMLLIMAECKANSNITEANSLLNKLRRARIKDWSDKNYLTKEEILQEILLERRRELCFEGHRFFDLRRFHLPIYKPMINKTLDVDNIRRIMPIPLAEMQGNNVIANQQNPGY